MVGCVTVVDCHTSMKAETGMKEKDARHNYLQLGDSATI